MRFIKNGCATGVVPILMLPWILLAGWVAVIGYFGTRRWGRSQTQALIDRVKQHPALHRFLNRHHGRLRSSFHYVELGGLTLIVYLLLSRFAGEPMSSWSDSRGAVTALVAAVGALLDELHQLRSGGRCFRMVDYLHSLCGISLALLFLRYFAL